MSAKYPRTSHLPWSPGGTKDDRRLLDVSTLINVDLVITEKCDGSNLSYTKEHVFSRSHVQAPVHPSFDFAKATHAQIRGQLTEGLSVFCEYCYAVHSIIYDALPGYSLIFGVRDDEKSTWWPWEMIEMEAHFLGLPTVPVLFRGRVSSSQELEELTSTLAQQPSRFGGEREGVVVRLAGEFLDSTFNTSIAKWVRAGHVQTDEHWLQQEIRPQRLVTS